MRPKCQGAELQNLQVQRRQQLRRVSLELLQQQWAVYFLSAHGAGLANLLLQQRESQRRRLCCCDLVFPVIGVLSI